MMDAEQQRRANSIFLAACELPPAEVGAFVQARCADDAPMLQRVLAMLAADAEQDAFLEASTPDATATPDEIVGERGYRLLKQIGEGGMGQVFLAERTDGSFKQRVAIKLLHRDHGPSRDALRRFRAERQILAALSHPNIAHLLDGGTLANGAPFLVMEYIDGERLDAWCQKRALDLRSRIALFLKVCDAVQVAHQSLIVHRDLKPSNILVTAEGEPKLLDFGIAKVLNAEWFAHSMVQTRTGDMPMTLAYASPEQVRGEPVGTASDVYALGVVLYELLTGTLPYRVAGPDPVGLARAVCEEQPEAPSRSTARRIAVGSEAPTAPTAPHQRVADSGGPLRRQLRGDLDAIVLKALRKESGARYGSVEKFAGDLRRYLDGQPVLARRGSGSYRLRKFLWRQRWPVGAGALLFSVLLGALLLLRAQLARTELERDKANHVAAFMVQMFARSDPAGDGARDAAEATQLTVREVMDSNAPRISTELAGNPEVQASLLAVVARIYDGLTLPEAAQRYGREALGQLQRSGQIPSRSSVDVRLFLAQSLVASAQLDAALTESELALSEIATLVDGDDFDRARALRVRGAVRSNLGQWQLAEEDGEAARAMFVRVRGADDPYAAGTLKDLALIAAGSGDFARCDRLIREALERSAVRFGRATLVVATMRATQAVCLTGLGDLSGAEAAYRENLETQRHILGSTSLAVGRAQNNLGDLLNQQHRYAEAEALLRESLSLVRARLGDKHSSLTQTLLNLSTSVFEQGRREEGIELQMQALALAPKTQRQQYAVAVNNLGYKLYQMDRKVEAEARLREALAIFDEVAPRHPDRAMTLSSLGRVLTESGRAKEAQGFIESALELRSAMLPADHWAIAESRSLLGACLAAQGRRAEAEPLLRRGLAGLTTALGPTHARTVRAQARLDAFLAPAPHP